MPTLKVEGLAETRDLVERLLRAPDNKLLLGLKRAGDVVNVAIRESGEAMGVHRTGGTLRSTTTKTPVRTATGAEVTVTFEGKNHKGVRYGEIAYYNEYGTRKQKARPFISRAEARSAKDAAEIIADTVFDDLDTD